MSMALSSLSRLTPHGPRVLTIPQLPTWSSPFPVSSAPSRHSWPPALSSLGRLMPTLVCFQSQNHPGPRPPQSSCQRAHSTLDGHPFFFSQSTALSSLSRLMPHGPRVLTIPQTSRALVPLIPVSSALSRHSTAAPVSVANPIHVGTTEIAHPNPTNPKVQPRALALPFLRHLDSLAAFPTQDSFFLESSDPWSSRPLSSLASL